MLEKLKIVLPRVVGGIGAGIAIWGYAKGIRNIEEITVMTLSELIVVSSTAYGIIHKLVSSKMNPGDTASTILNEEIKVGIEAAKEGEQ